MFGPIRMNFNTKELIVFGAGMLVSLAIVTLFGAKSETPLEQCEYQKSECETELDQCIATQR